MKTHLFSSSVSFLRAACGFALAALCSAQFVPLAYAGAPTKTPDSSTPAESRIPIGPTTTPGDADATPSLFKITQPGSYYLTGNIAGVAGKDGIEVAANHVTIDLNGYTVQGTAGGSIGIAALDTHKALSVRNGVITGWLHGIYAASDDGIYEHLELTDNLGAGLWVGQAVVNDCVASGNGQFGVRALTSSVLTRVVAHHNQQGISTIGGGANVVDCSAYENTGNGLQIQDDGNSLVGCRATNNGGDGLNCGPNSTLDRCTAKNNAGRGFVISTGSTVAHSTAFFNDMSGFKLSLAVTISDSTATSNTQDGIEATGGVRVDNCVAAGNGRHGFQLGPNSEIRGSIARQNTVVGIRLESGGVAESNLAVSNGLQAPSNTIGAGIDAAGSGSRIDSNTCVGNSYGFLVSTPNSLVIRNTARGNIHNNYYFASGAQYGEIITSPGAAFVATNPWANFAY